MIDLEDVEFLSDAIPIFIYMFIFTPIILYHSWRFYLQRDHIVIQRRYGNITLSEVVFGITEIWLRSITILAGFVCPNAYLNIAFECLDSYFVALVFVTWDMRFFHLYYGMYTYDTVYL